MTIIIVKNRVFPSMVNRVYKGPRKNAFVIYRTHREVVSSYYLEGSHRELRVQFRPLAMAVPLFKRTRNSFLARAAVAARRMHLLSPPKASSNRLRARARHNCKRATILRSVDATINNGRPQKKKIYIYMLRLLLFINRCRRVNNRNGRFRSDRSVVLRKRNGRGGQGN